MKFGKIFWYWTGIGADHDDDDDEDNDNDDDDYYNHDDDDDDDDADDYDEDNGNDADDDDDHDDGNDVDDDNDVDDGNDVDNNRDSLIIRVSHSCTTSSFMSTFRPSVVCIFWKFRPLSTDQPTTHPSPFLTHQTHPTWPLIHNIVLIYEHFAFWLVPLVVLVLCY